jgi:phage gpG-like protein
MIRVEVEEKGLGDILLALDQLGGSYRDPIEESLLSILESTEEKFEGEWDGKAKWEELSPKRIKQRGSAHPILRDNGLMFASITPDRGTNSIFEVSDTIGTVGTRDKKAAYHQFGTKFMPARPFLTLTEDDRLAITLIFKAHVQDTIDKAQGGPA